MTTNQDHPHESAAQANKPAIAAVIFDMGGVLVELGPLENLLGGEAALSVEEFWKRWLASPTVRAFEMGECSIEAFGDNLVAEMGLPFDGAEFIERFRQWPQGLYPGVVELVARIPEAVITGVLSNTNELHWSAQVDHETVQTLTRRPYLSYQVGLAKPDAPIYLHVIDDLGLAPEQILFIDDNQINVDGARAVGMQAELARGPIELEQALSSWKLI